jgi:hypothetical protein
MYVCAERALSPGPATGPDLTTQPLSTVAHPVGDSSSGDGRDIGGNSNASRMAIDADDHLALINSANDAMEPGHREAVTPAEMTVVVGLVNLPLVVLYVAVYSLAGRWDTYVREPIEHNGCGGTLRAVLYLWTLQGVMYWAHYLSFYWVAKQGSSVAAGVNKVCLQPAIMAASPCLFSVRPRHNH